MTFRNRLIRKQGYKLRYTMEPYSRVEIGGRKIRGSSVSDYFDFMNSVFASFFLAEFRRKQF